MFEIDLNLLLLIGNIICAVGTLQLILTAVKNRKILFGYSLSGSILTFVALTLFNTWYALMGQYLTFAFGAITLIYWFSVICFKLKYRKEK